MVWFDVAMNARGEKGASAQYFHFLTMSEIKGCSSHARWTSGSSRQYKFMTRRDQRSTGLSELRCCFHHTPHTVNLQQFQLPHNVCVRLGVEVHEAAVCVTEDELEARLALDANGAVKLAPQ